MKILITGATGFIGNNVTKELLKNNHEVIATSSNESRAKNCSWFNNVRYVDFDLSRFDSSIDYYSEFNKPDVIIHLAWEGLPNYNSLFHIERNLFRHYSFLKNMIVNGANDITVTGTCLEYGLQEGELSEDLPSRPSNSYAIAKDSLRRFLEQLQKDIPFNFKWARLFYMYGEGQNPNAILPQLIKVLDENANEFNMSHGDQQRDYLPIETVAEYITKIAIQTKVAGIINCCSGIPITINHLVDNFLKRQNQSIKLNKGFYPYDDYEPMHFWGDTSRLKEILFK